MTRQVVVATVAAAARGRAMSTAQASGAGSLPPPGASFGSFFSGNVDAMIRTELDAWPVPLPTAGCPPAVTLPSSDQPLQPGSPALRRLFMLDPEFAFLNHGAFGATLKPIHEQASRWRTYQEAQPLRFFDRVLLPHQARNWREVAKFINAQPKDVVLLPNATTGLNAAIEHVVRTAASRSNSVILSTSLAYGAVKTMLAVACQRHGVQQVECDLPLSSAAPLTTRGVLAALQNSVERILAEGGQPTALVLDHITSNTAARLPIEELAGWARDQGIDVLVDGAHGLWQEPLDMASMQRSGIKAYVTNTHKWLCGAKSAAVMWVDPAWQDHLRPLIVSHGYRGGFLEAFSWDGCRDYAAVLTLADTIQLWRDLDLSACRAYTSQLLDRVVQQCLATFGTTEPLDPELRAANMRLVPLPRWVHPKRPLTGDDAPELQERLYRRNIEVPVKRINQGQELCVRLSAHVYNTEADYAPLLEAFATESSAMRLE
ncbi:uncharacterized protein MONBRDRAFT_6280 [Monosiga brevicollis MX1]|uniref:Aminotransferase class V domain-containing protein n=1 Tax=Monosiga brevicollis TaxID=81824 RepID=A9UTD0_MONBE|nr:uncharacterized protein MONBRDRAFT_6280 [Monosiga brevicollis MX1]EDQ91470.1 predicted protein [Monosiga brevicollis MX1]|eukprot:XP_001743892.1 hypothetical protein [Monosiga brevicollis MX1]